MTTVRLYKDIGLDPSFKKTIDFTSKSAQSSWFASKTYKQLENVNYNKPQNLLKIPNMDYSEAVSYTYCSLIDLDSSDLREYYFFIESTAVVDSNTVQFQLTLDPIQTFMCEFEIGECLVTREHVDRWNSGDVPARITPTGEGIIASQVEKYTSSLVVSGYDFAIVSLVFTSPKLKLGDWDVEFKNRIFHGVFPVDIRNYSRRIPTAFSVSVARDGQEAQVATHSAYFPCINDIVTGNLNDWIPVASDSQLSMSISSICGCSITQSSNQYYVCRENLIGDIPQLVLDYSTQGEVNIETLEVLPLTTDITQDTNIKVMQVFTPEQMLDNMAEITINYTNAMLPEKPTDGATASSRYEPALYMEPFVTRSIMTKKGELLLNIPDIIMLNEELKFNCKNLFTSSGIVNVISVGNYEEDNPVRLSAMGSQTTHICPALDVISDAWKSYVLTRRDTDRQAVTNESWRQGINNVLFMGYGGALVGSRSASGSRDSPDRRNELLNSGTMKASAIAIPTAIAGSLIDAHYAWEAQMLKEKQIQNEPSILMQAGDSIQTIVNGMGQYTLVVTAVDDVNWDRAYEKFRKYGYTVNIYEKPNTRSRKYFNYVLTNGAVVTGALNTEIKRAIARIFDCGITIFHGDKTSTLEYPEYENIERSLI